MEIIKIFDRKAKYTAILCNNSFNILCKTKDIIEYKEDIPQPFRGAAVGVAINRLLRKKVTVFRDGIISRQNEPVVMSNIPQGVSINYFTDTIWESMKNRIKVHIESHKMDLIEAPDDIIDDDAALLWFELNYGGN